VIVKTVIWEHGNVEKNTIFTLLSHNRKKRGAGYDLPIVTEKWSEFIWQANPHKQVKPIHPKTYRLHGNNNQKIGGFTIYERKK